MHQGRRRRPVRPPPGLLGCGVMAGIGAGDQQPGGVSRGDSVAVFGCGGCGRRGDRRCGLALAGVDDRRGRHRRPEARVGEGVRRDRTPINSTPARARSRRIRELTGGNGVDVAIEAIRPARGLPAVLSRLAILPAAPVFWSACPLRHGADAAVPRRVRAGRRPLVRAGTATACRAATFDADRPWYRQGRLDLDGFVSEIISASAASRRRSTRWSGARCCVPWWRSEQPDRPRSSAAGAFGDLKLVGAAVQAAGRRRRPCCLWRWCRLAVKPAVCGADDHVGSYKTRLREAARATTPTTGVWHASAHDQHRAHHNHPSSMRARSALAVDAVLPACTVGGCCSSLASS